MRDATPRDDAQTRLDGALGLGVQSRPINASKNDCANPLHPSLRDLAESAWVGGSAQLASMKQQFPPVEATSPLELRAKLAAIDIGVVRRPERRTHSSRERYSAVRALATISHSELLEFPIRVEFRDGPDVALHMPAGSIGVECVDAIAEEWAEILDLKASQFPGAIISLPRLKPGVRTLSQDDLRAYASGKKAGPPLIGDSVEQDWAQAMLHYVKKKLEKLRAGDYPDYAENWLLVHDGWIMRPVSDAEQRKAVSLLLRERSQLFTAPSFSRIFIEGSNWLTLLGPGEPKVTPIVDLWN